MQLGAYADRDRASRFRDSLATAGWAAYAPETTIAGRPVMRVRLAVSDSLVAVLVAEALRARGWAPTVARERAELAHAHPTKTTAIPVVRTAVGMSAELHWRRSPEGSRLLVVEDPVSIEADPIPDDFVLVSDDGIVIRGDSAWDVAPSPDWRWLAMGRARRIGRGDRDPTPEEWRAFGRERWAAGLPADSVRRGAFQASGMGIMWGLSRPVLVSTSQSLNDASDARPLAMLGGWRVRWTRDGRHVLVGANPRGTADNAPSPGYVAVRWPEGTIDTAAPIADSASAQWDGTTQLVFDDGEPHASFRRTFSSGMTLTSDGQWTTLVDSRSGRARIVGPGAVLETTRDGRYALVLVRRASRPANDRTVDAIIYRVGQ